MVRLGQHPSFPHAVVALLYQYVAGSAHVLHVVPREQMVPVGVLGSVAEPVGSRCLAELAGAPKAAKSSVRPNAPAARVA
jgi:hypothetical protein